MKLCQAALLRASLRPLPNQQRHHHLQNILTSSQMWKTQVARQEYGVVPQLRQIHRLLQLHYLVLLLWLPLSCLPHHICKSSLAPSPEVEAKTRVSRTTEWRHKKMGKKSETRNTYTCRMCSQPIASEGHTQYRGQRYCPYSPGEIPPGGMVGRLKKDQ